MFHQCFRAAFGLSKLAALAQVLKRLKFRRSGLVSDSFHCELLT